MITEDMVRSGIREHLITFIVDPNMGSGTVCSIGDSWFYLVARRQKMRRRKSILQTPHWTTLSEKYMRFWKSSIRTTTSETSMRTTRPC